MLFCWIWPVHRDKAPSLMSQNGPPSISSTLARVRVKLGLNHRHESWLSLIIIDYHWLSLIILIPIKLLQTENHKKSRSFKPLLPLSSRHRFCLLTNSVYRKHSGRNIKTYNIKPFASFASWNFLHNQHFHAAHSTFSPQSSESPIQTGHWSLQATSSGSYLPQLSSGQLWELACLVNGLPWPSTALNTTEQYVTIYDSFWLVLTRMWKSKSPSGKLASCQVVRKSAESMRVYESLRESTRVYDTRTYKSYKTIQNQRKIRKCKRSPSVPFRPGCLYEVFWCPPWRIRASSRLYPPCQHRSWGHRR